MTPFFFFYAGSSIIFFIFIHRDGDVFSLITNLLLGGFIGSASLVKESSGFSMFWFLPTLFGFVLVLGFFETLTAPRRQWFVLLSFFLHGVVALIPKSIASHIPFGLVIVGHVFILGLFVRWVFSVVGSRNPHPFRLFFLLLFLACYLTSWYWGSHNELGLLSIDSILTPGPLLLHDLLGVSGFFVILLFAPLLAHLPFIIVLGRFSLIIYLVHPLVFFALKQAWPGAFSISVGWSPGYLLLTVASIALTLFLSYLIARLIARTAWLHDLVTPRGLADWLPIKVWQKVSARGT